MTRVPGLGYIFMLDDDETTGPAESDPRIVVDSRVRLRRHSTDLKELLKKHVWRSRDRIDT